MVVAQQRAQVARHGLKASDALGHAAGSKGHANQLQTFERQVVKVDLAAHAAQAANLHPTPQNGHGLHVLGDGTSTHRVEQQIHPMVGRDGLHPLGQFLAAQVHQVGKTQA